MPAHIFMKNAQTGATVLPTDVTVTTTVDSLSLTVSIENIGENSLWYLFIANSFGILNDRFFLRYIPRSGWMHYATDVAALQYLDQDIAQPVLPCFEPVSINWPSPPKESFDEVPQVLNTNIVNCTGIDEAYCQFSWALQIDTMISSNHSLEHVVNITSVADEEGNMYQLEPMTFVIKKSSDSRLISHLDASGSVSIVSHEILDPSQQAEESFAITRYHAQDLLSKALYGPNDVFVVWLGKSEIWTEEKSRTDQMFSSDARTIEEVAYARGIHITYLCKVDDLEFELLILNRVWHVRVNVPYKSCPMGSASDPFCPRCVTSYHTVSEQYYFRQFEFGVPTIEHNVVVEHLQSGQLAVVANEGFTGSTSKLFHVHSNAINIPNPFEDRTLMIPILAYASSTEYTEWILPLSSSVGHACGKIGASIVSFLNQSGLCDEKWNACFEASIDASFSNSSSILESVAGARSRLVGTLETGESRARVSSSFDEVTLDFMEVPEPIDVTIMLSSSSLQIPQPRLGTFHPDDWIFSPNLTANFERLGSLSIPISNVGDASGVFNAKLTCGTGVTIQMAEFSMEIAAGARENATFSLEGLVGEYGERTCEASVTINSLPLWESRGVVYDSIDSIQIQIDNGYFVAEEDAYHEGSRMRISPSQAIMSDGKICDISLKQNIIEGLKCFDIDIVSPQSGDIFVGNDVDVVLSFSGVDDGDGVWLMMWDNYADPPEEIWSKLNEYQTELALLHDLKPRGVFEMGAIYLLSSANEEFYPSSVLEFPPSNGKLKVSFQDLPQDETYSLFVADRFVRLVDTLGVVNLTTAHVNVVQGHVSIAVGNAPLPWPLYDRSPEPTTFCLNDLEPKTEDDIVPSQSSTKVKQFVVEMCDGEDVASVPGLHDDCTWRLRLDIELSGNHSDVFSSTLASVRDPRNNVFLLRNPISISMEKTSDSEAIFPLAEKENVAPLYERTDTDLSTLAQRMIESYQNIYPVSREYVQERVDACLLEEEMHLFRGKYTTISNTFLRDEDQTAQPQSTDMLYYEGHPVYGRVRLVNIGFEVLNSSDGTRETFILAHNPLSDTRAFSDPFFFPKHWLMLDQDVSTHIMECRAGSSRNLDCPHCNSVGHSFAVDHRSLLASYSIDAENANVDHHMRLQLESNSFLAHMGERNISVPFVESSNSSSFLSGTDGIAVLSSSLYIGKSYLSGRRLVTPEPTISVSNEHQWTSRWLFIPEDNFGQGCNQLGVHWSEFYGDENFCQAEFGSCMQNGLSWFQQQGNAFNASLLPHYSTRLQGSFEDGESPNQRISVEGSNLQMTFAEPAAPLTVSVYLDDTLVEMREPHISLYSENGTINPNLAPGMEREADLVVGIQNTGDATADTVVSVACPPEIGLDHDSMQILVPSNSTKHVSFKAYGSSGTYGKMPCNITASTRTHDFWSEDGKTIEKVDYFLIELENGYFIKEIDAYHDGAEIVGYVDTLHFGTGCTSISLQPSCGSPFIGSTLDVSITFSGTNASLVTKTESESGYELRQLSSYATKLALLKDLRTPLHESDQWEARVYLLDITSSPHIVHFPNDVSVFPTSASEIKVAFSHLLSSSAYVLFVEDSFVSNDLPHVSLPTSVVYYGSDAGAHADLNARCTQDPVSFCTHDINLKSSLNATEMTSSSEVVQSSLVNHASLGSCNELVSCNWTLKLNISSFGSDVSTVLSSVMIDEVPLDFNPIDISFRKTNETRVIVPLVEKKRMPSIYEYSEGNSFGIELAQDILKLPISSDDANQYLAMISLDPGFYQYHVYNSETLEYIAWEETPGDATYSFDAKQIQESMSPDKQSFSAKFTEDGNDVFLSLESGILGVASYQWYLLEVMEGTSCPAGSARNGDFCPSCPSVLHQLVGDWSNRLDVFIPLLEARILDPYCQITIQSINIPVLVSQRTEECEMKDTELTYSENRLFSLSNHTFIPNLDAFDDAYLLVHDVSNVDTWRIWPKKDFGGSLDSIDVTRSAFLGADNFCDQEYGTGLEKSARHILEAESDRGMSQLDGYETFLFGVTENNDHEQVNRIRLNEDDTTMILQYLMPNEGYTYILDIASGVIQTREPKIATIATDSWIFTPNVTGGYERFGTISGNVSNAGEGRGLFDITLECDGVFSLNLTKSVVIEGGSSSAIEWQLEGAQGQYGNVTCNNLTVEVATLPVFSSINNVEKVDINMAIEVEDGFFIPEKLVLNEGSSVFSTSTNIVRASGCFSVQFSPPSGSEISFPNANVTLLFGSECPFIQAIRESDGEKILRSVCHYERQIDLLADLSNPMFSNQPSSGIFYLEDPRTDVRYFPSSIVDFPPTGNTITFEFKGIEEKQQLNIFVMDGFVERESLRVSDISAWGHYYTNGATLVAPIYQESGARAHECWNNTRANDWVSDQCNHPKVGSVEFTYSTSVVKGLDGDFYVQANAFVPMEMSLSWLISVSTLSDEEGNNYEIAPVNMTITRESNVSIVMPLSFRHHLDAVEDVVFVSGSMNEFLDDELQWFSVEREIAQTLLDCIAENPCELSVWSKDDDMFVTWHSSETEWLYTLNAEEIENHIDANDSEEYICRVSNAETNMTTLLRYQNKGTSSDDDNHWQIYYEDDSHRIRTCSLDSARNFAAKRMPELCHTLQRNTVSEFRLYEIEWNQGAIDVGLSVQIESISFQEAFGSSSVRESIEIPLVGDSVHSFSSFASNVIMDRHVEFDMKNNSWLLIDHKKPQHRYWKFISAEDFANCSVPNVPVTEFMNSNAFCESIEHHCRHQIISESLSNTNNVFTSCLIHPCSEIPEDDAIAFDIEEKTITISQMQTLENQNITIRVPLKKIQVMEPFLAPFDLGQWQFMPNSTEAGERGAKISLLVRNDGYKAGQFQISMSCGNFVVVDPPNFIIEIGTAETHNITFKLESVANPSIHDKCFATGSLLNQLPLWSDTAKATVVSNGMPFILESGLFLPECVSFSEDEAFLLMEKEMWEMRDGDWIAENEQNQLLKLEFGEWIPNDENGYDLDVRFNIATTGIQERPNVTCRAYCSSPIDISARLTTITESVGSDATVNQRIHIRDFFVSPEDKKASCTIGCSVDGNRCWSDVGKRVRSELLLSLPPVVSSDDVSSSDSSSPDDSDSFWNGSFGSFIRNTFGKVCFFPLRIERFPKSLTPHNCFVTSA
eukprot:TRINITY_DN1153_c0_g1_i2.p1 TRINITY_DN1153_c0_g1~~TRINITY_DN1153_c0_g1_i2.p1  ORF type:complete len:3300 (-),score=693.97 TRINITY_DN1153_c0_g1_i2:4267-13728(-)